MLNCNFLLFLETKHLRNTDMFLLFTNYTLNFWGFFFFFFFFCYMAKGVFLFCFGFFPPSRSFSVNCILCCDDHSLQANSLIFVCTSNRNRTWFFSFFFYSRRKCYSFVFTRGVRLMLSCSLYVIL